MLSKHIDVRSRYLANTFAESPTFGLGMDMDIQALLHVTHGPILQLQHALLEWGLEMTEISPAHEDRQKLVC